MLGRTARADSARGWGRSGPLWSVLGLLCIAGVAPAQEPELLRVERLTDAGDVQEARQALVRWEERFGDSAALELRARAWYLAGRLAEDGAEAELRYLKVVIEAPNSAYADDALLQLARYHFARGDHARSLDHLGRLRREYPTSEHAAGALLWIARGARSHGDSARACAAAEQGLREVPPSDSELARGLEEIRSSCTGGTGAHSVQVAALQDADGARRLAQRLREQGYDAWVREPATGDRLYRVRVGRGLAAAQAQALVERLVAGGYSPFLVTESEGSGGTN